MTNFSLWVKKRQRARTKARTWFLGVTVMAYMLLVSLALVLKGWGSNPDPKGGDGGGGGGGAGGPVSVVAQWEGGEAGGQGGEGARAAVAGGPAVRQRREAQGSNIANFVTLRAEDANGSSSASGHSENCTPRAVHNFPDNFISLRDTQDGGVFIHILIALYLFAALAIVCDDYFVPALERICEDLGLQADVAGATFMAAGSSAPELCTSVVGVFIAQSDVGVGTIVGSAVFNILFIVGLCAIFAGMVVTLTWYPLVRDTLFYLLSVTTLVLVIEDSRVHWYEALAMLLLYGLYILLMVFNRRLETRALGALDAFRARWRGHGGPADPEEKQGLLGNSHSGGASPRDGEGQEEETGFGSRVREESEEKEDDRYESPWEIPDSFLPRVYWVATTPVRALCYVTVPDCRRGGGWRRLYPLTFLLSVVWIGVFTYVMVWMITIAGDALNIPDTVMGLTLLAAGTSLPDCLTSVLVARDGYGDMAVSNSIGSNVFDILLCLGLPWLIDTAAFKGGDSLGISSSGLLYSSLTLLATVFFLLVSVAANRWRLTRGYGAVCLVVYIVVITLSSLYELNVFSDLNPPACPR